MSCVRSSIGRALTAILKLDEGVPLPPRSCVSVIAARARLPRAAASNAPSAPQAASRTRASASSSPLVPVQLVVHATIVNRRETRDDLVGPAGCVPDPDNDCSPDLGRPRRRMARGPIARDTPEVLRLARLPLPPDMTDAERGRVGRAA